MKYERRWDEKEQEREIKHGQRDGEILSDFGMTCGKSEQENPLIIGQLQHMELDLLQGVIFLFSNSASFLPQ